ncbi:ORC ubiquitin ligase 1 [Electrophorus electricus]|uniref:RING-type domain-containing protein n=1 Tax=Electrophorus electricus TaxID=8005 RepID=A0A4W4EQL0_ELEEL|nr:ORC ubiquitin ligase 1 [Electrophorus electricus]
MSRVQNVTLSLTLPISCQICLGKVRKPTICCNNHVFCFGCLDVWLKKSSQCPTCRVAITPENPCREIIGATNDSDSNESYSVKKCLRKTRGELLLREYEEEIETLLKENENLKTKNSSLEAQLNTALEPSTVLVSRSETPADHSLLEDSANKLRAASDLCKKLKQDMDKLKEANKTLRSQNVDLIQGNMRLKTEVENRSPQKFGRCTVAALEAKVQRYERELSQLKRALERSDTYIEELEAQMAASRRGGAPATEGAQGRSSASVERQGEGVQRSRIATMRRSLSEMEEPSVYTDLDRKSTPMGLPDGCGLLLTTSGMHRGMGLLCGAGEEALQDAGIPSTPSTPSSSLSCLSLRSPAGRGEARPDTPRLPYLRRLRFEDRGIAVGMQGPATPAEGTLWGVWQDPCTSLSTNKARCPPSGDRLAGHSQDSMDAAYLDKISELDSMMAECEGSSSQTSQPPLALPEFCVPLTADRGAGDDLLTDPFTVTEEQTIPTARDLSEAKNHAPFSIPAWHAGRSSAAAGKEAEASGESKKRKSAVTLATCSPSKLSKINK